jgi:hypothetical protein
VVSERTNWIAHLKDGVRLEDSQGALVCILQRKTAAVFLALAKSGAKGISRDQIADRLWPNASLDDQRTSLRQCLTRLRKALGEETILSDRSTFRLRPGLTIEIVESDSPIGFGEEDQLVAPSPLEGLLSFSEWLSKNEPSQLFESLRTNLEFALHLPPHRLLNLVNEAEPRLSENDPIRNWAYFWRGASSVQDGVRQAAPLLREATNRAFAAGDRLLIREASYLLAVCEILVGDAQKALDLSDRAIAAIRDRDLHHCGRFADLRSSALLHLGFKDEALKVLERRTGNGEGTQLEFAKNEALRALYTATGGNLDRAYQVNQNPYKISREIGAKGVELICCLTSGYIEAMDQPEKGVERLIHLVRYCKQNGFNHLALYGQETLALAYRNSDRGAEAKDALKTSVNQRKSLGFRYTRWDQTRLRGLASLSA